ncbi:hypothetical protein Ancab_037260 [Ancistrocladus abbreviatus]
MLQRATTRLFLRPIVAATTTSKPRSLSTVLPAAQAADQMFVEAWRKVVPNTDPPNTPLSFMQPRPPVSSSIPSKLAINFYLAYYPELSNREMGILPGHVGAIAELNAGVLTVHEGNNVTKYFISGGFAFVHPNSVTDLVAVEAVSVDQIDSNLVKKGVAESTQKLIAASTDYEKAEAQIGLDVYGAQNSALSG